MVKKVPRPQGRLNHHQRLPDVARDAWGADFIDGGTYGFEGHEWMVNPRAATASADRTQDMSHSAPYSATIGGGMGLLIGTFAAATLAKRRRAAAQARAHATKGKKH
jgi:hypothetical protein